MSSLDENYSSRSNSDTNDVLICDGNNLVATQIMIRNISNSMVLENVMSYNNESTGNNIINERN